MRTRRVVRWDQAQNRSRVYVTVELRVPCCMSRRGKVQLP